MMHIYCIIIIVKSHSVVKILFPIAKETVKCMFLYVLFCAKKKCSIVQSDTVCLLQNKEKYLSCSDIF